MKSEADLSLLARQWGATAVPFGLVNANDWLETTGSQQALNCLSQTAALRSVLLLSGPNGVGKSALVGRWMRSLDQRLFCPVCLTQATLSGTAILASLATKLGKPVSFYRQRNLQLLEEALQELDRRILVVILDEAQNTTSEQMMMFLTRLGEDSRMVVTGDVTQIDLPRAKQSGLLEARHILGDIPGIDFHTFASSDVVRPPLVQKIIEAYDRFRHPITSSHEEEEKA